MKKRVLAAILAAGMILSLTGCEGEEPVALQGTVETTEIQTNETETTVQETESSTETEVSTIKKEPGETVDYFSFRDQLYLLDEYGYITENIQLDDVMHADFLTEKQIELLEDGSFEDLDGDRYVFSCYHMTPMLLVVDLTNSQCYEISAGTSEYFKNVESYQGNLYLDVYDPDKGYQKEYMYVFDGTGYIEQENPLEDVIDTYGDDFAYMYNENQKTYVSKMGEWGYLVAKIGGKFYQIDAKGNKTKISLEYGTDVYSCSKRYIFYEAAIEDLTSFGGYDYYVYDVETKECIQIPSEYRNVYLSGDKVFVLVDESEEYGIAAMHLYDYDIYNGELEEVYACEDVPGFYTVSGQSGLRFKNDIIYYINEEKDGSFWYMSKYTDAGYSPECLDVVYEETPLTEFGNYTYSSYTEKCDNCGYAYGLVYVEGFELTIDAPGVSAINKEIAAYCKNECDSAVTTIADYGLAEEEEMHGDLFCIYSYDMHVNDVKLLSDDYVAIYFGGYDYSGGAHGYPYLEQLVFDLNTGSRLDILSMYPGSEDELRDLIATKTVEDYNNRAEDNNPYFGGDENSVYEDAYDCCIGGSTIFVEEDGIIVNYYPYNMGPYAAGFIDVFVSYEELGIKLN